MPGTPSVDRIRSIPAIMAIEAIYKGLFFASILVGVLSQAIPEQEKRPSLDLNERPAPSSEELKLAEERLMEEQAANAVYNFATSVVDGIMDNMQVRTESRDGLNVKGSYAYSDGFFRRLVDYVADQNGYRVVSESVEPLGDGPRFNPEGQANVKTSIGGENYEYTITKSDIGKFNEPRKEAAAAA